MRNVFTLKKNSQFTKIYDTMTVIYKEIQQISKELSINSVTVNLGKVIYELNLKNCYGKDYL